MLGLATPANEEDKDDKKKDKNEKKLMKNNKERKSNRPMVESTIEHEFGFNLE